jgi:hypothetical protein
VSVGGEGKGKAEAKFPVTPYFSGFSHLEEFLAFSSFI